MTIDDDIEMLELIHEDYRGCRQGVALENAIRNLRKYQKIEQILNDDSYYEYYGSKAGTFIVSAICDEVLKSEVKE